MPFSTKQKTLFQAWKKPHVNDLKKKTPDPVATPSSSTFIDLSAEDVDDDDLLSATVALENQDQSNQDSTNNGFDVFAGKLWIYPTNYPIRSYQYSIVNKALFENTLVALPTGLGKTFIAAVVMYNFYRWYPQGKIVFMAPTKPLVSQQIDACYNIMGIPMEDQAQITGSTMASNRREELWSSKRVFFLTPQVINNDLTRGVCPAVDVKCLVVDEAHKALGNHAYCQVVQQLLAYNRDFRVLALSATPGSDLKSVQQVLNNLLISHIEVRSEDSIDIQQYTHSRKVDKIVVKLDQKILDIKEKYMNVIEVFINNLVSNKALYNKDVSYLSKYAMLMSRDQFRKDPPSGLSRQTMGIIEGDFAITISLYHGLELLLQHGMKSFFIFLKGIVEGSKGNMRSKTILQSNKTFISIYNELTKLYGDAPGSVVMFTQASSSQSKRLKDQEQTSNSLYVYGHPKMKKLEEVVVNHFETFNKSDTETRVMVFCQYRDSVREITELLQTHRPLIRPMQFVGHAPSTNPTGDTPSNKNKRFTQKDQLMVVSKFRSGGYNTLVSTCVGEEGLDIGDVDLIVCFDSHKSPIRLVQRMGRTGRKRAGRIVMLVTEGKEERDYNSSVASRKSIHKAITGAGKNLHYYPHNPRMLPKGLHPTCHKMFITVAKKPTAEKKVKTKPNKSADVSVMLKKVVQQSHDKSLLTETQQETWKAKCQLTVHEKVATKKLPKFGEMVSLDKKLFQLKCQNNNLSLSEWLPWQHRLQPTMFVGHSSRSELLTEVLNVCDQMKNDDSHENLLQTSVSIKNTQKEKRLKTRKTSLNKIDKQKPQLELESLTTTTQDDILILSDDQENTEGNEVPDKAIKECISNPPAMDILENTQNQFDDPAGDTKFNEFVTPKAIGSKRVLDQGKSFSFSENLSAIFPTPLPCKPDKIESRHSSEIKIPSPPHMDSLAFDFLDDIDADNGSDNDHHTKHNQRSCFQIWDSDVTQQNSKHNEKSNAESTELKKIETIVKHDETNLQHCAGEENETKNKTDASSQKKSASFEECVKVYDGISLNNNDSTTEPVHDERGCSDSDTQNDNVNTALLASANTANTQSLQEPPYQSECIANKNQQIGGTELPCNKKNVIDKTHLKNVLTSSMPGGESFNMSADMFHPQFDLNFDLECESFIEERNANHQKDTVLKCANPDKKEFSKESKPRSTENNVETELPCTSVDLSQYKRKKNQKLFADLSVSSDHTVPVAAVKPQRLSPDKSDIRKDTSLPPPEVFQQKRVAKSLKRQRSPTLVKSSDEGSESDDFVCSRKKRCLNVSKSNDTTSSLDVTPVRVKRSNRHQVLSSDEEIAPTSETGSPVLSAKTKNTKLVKSFIKTQQAFSPLVSHSSRRHSTPKVNLFERSENVKCNERNFTMKQAKTKKSTRKMNCFLDDEAEVSVDAELMSSDEDIYGEEWDEEMMQFVNDATQLTQNVAADETAPDVHAMYLKSIQSPLSKQNKPSDVANFKGKYKLAYGKGCDIDVFSQDIEQDISGYAEDSFVVDNNESEYCEDLGEITILSSHQKSSNLDEESFGTNRPKTRREVKLQKAMHSKINKNVKGQKTDNRRRIIVCDDSDDTDTTDIDQPFQNIASSPEYWRCSKCTLVNSKKLDKCQACGCHQLNSTPTVVSPTRFCEICGNALTLKGWLCQSCLDLLKKSEQDESGKKLLSVESPLPHLNPQNNSKSSPALQAVNQISREERLLKSKQKQQELRSKHKEKINSSCHKSFLDEEKSPYCLPTGDTLKNQPRFSPIKMKNLDTSVHASSPCRKKGKLVVMVDSHEVNSGAGRLVQLLRTQYNVNAVVASLQTCDYAISCRTAVFRKTVSDISSATCRQKLSTNVNNALAFYTKVYLIIEKNREKQAKAGGNMSTSQLNNFVSNMVAILQGNVQVLYSDNQDESAKLLHTIASQELNNGHAIDSAVVETSTAPSLKNMLNICITLPGVSYPCALHLCSNFRSMKSLCNSSPDEMMKKGQLSLDNANKLKKFFTKCFDVQMMPG